MTAIYSGVSSDSLKAIRNHLSNFEKSLSEADKRIIQLVSPYTMCPPSRILDTIYSARQAGSSDPGAAIIEFGVYKGGMLGACVSPLNDSPIGIP